MRQLTSLSLWDYIRCLAVLTELDWRNDFYVLSKKEKDSANSTLVQSKYIHYNASSHSLLSLTHTNISDKQSTIYKLGTEILISKGSFLSSYKILFTLLFQFVFYNRVSVLAASTYSETHLCSFFPVGATNIYLSIFFVARIVHSPFFLFPLFCVCIHTSYRCTYVD